MQEVQYVGEHLIWGKIGHFSILLGFCAAILSFIGYAFQVQTQNSSWNKIGRIGFTIHGLSIYALIAMLFYVMVNKYYEYVYAYEHVSDTLPMEYILSAFWEGQEGSFILWMFWHIFLGWILMTRNGKWEAPVMATLALIEVVINSMILGIHIEIGDFVYKMGSNPTLLLRDVLQAPIFAKADYLGLIEGTGLNPLLQNYWNVIHPPTLFLGFASTAIPFCFAVAGLWTGQHKEWLKPALKWSLFSAGIFGTGLLMGSAWAYEALSFGGYWAWDPVENASFVPWVVLVAGVHTNLIARSTGHSIKSTYVFYILTFVLVLYSTFLTRSGILGDTSAHAFTEMGLEWQLVAMVAVFLFLGFGFFFTKYSQIPTVKKEESGYSREFWMFIGSLVLLFSATLISVSTSLPVFNSIMSYFDEGFVGKVINDPVPHYNKFQVWIAVFVSILSGITLFLRYKNESVNKRIKKLGIRTAVIFAISAASTYALTFWLNLVSWQYYLLAFTSFAGIFLSLDYIISVVKGNLKVAASAVSHFGFSAMILGVLASGLNSSHISFNPFMFKDVFKDEDLGKYVLLFKNDPLFMNGYWATYTGDTLIGHDKTFFINIRQVDAENNTIDEFELKPNLIYNNDYSKVAAYNPDASHYLGKDVFCNMQLPIYQSSAEEAKKMEDSLEFKTYFVIPGDTLITAENTIVVGDLSLDPKVINETALKQDLTLSVQLDFLNKEKDDTTRIVKPALSLSEQLVYNYPQKIEKRNTIARINETFFNKVYTAEDQLNYSTKTIKQGESIVLNNMTFTLNGFDQEILNPNYKQEEGDIAVSGVFDIELKTGEVSTLKPIFVIRGNQPFSIKDYDANLGLHLRLANIDPANNTFEVKWAFDDRTNLKIPLEICEEVPRTDLIVFEARIFPGINIFWVGSILMIFGFFMAMARKMFGK